MTGPEQEQTSSVSDSAKPGSGKIYNILLALILVGGAIIITVLYQHSVHMDQLDVSVQVDEGSETLLSVLNPPEAYPNPALDEIFNTLNQIRNDAVDQDIDQGFMDSYLWDESLPGLETTSLEYVLIVPRNERFEGLPEGFRLLRDADGELEEVPDREVYYPVFIESAPQDQGTVIGVDRTIDNVFLRVATEQAIDTGEVVSYAYFPLVGSTGSQVMVSRNMQAIYDNGVVPETVEGRRAAAKGVVVAASYYSDEAVVSFVPAIYQGIESIYFPQTDSYRREDTYQEIRDGLAAGEYLEIPFTFYTRDNKPYMSLTRATPELKAALQTNGRWWVLILGTLITMWLAGLVLWYKRQSVQIISLVNSRTRDLAQRSEKLQEVNVALQESEQRYRMLAENVDDVIYTHNLEGICTYVSPSVHQQTGFSTDDYLGHPFTKHLPPESAKRIESTLGMISGMSPEEFRKMRGHNVVECEIYCKDGSIMPIENKVSFILDDEGAPAGILCVSRDISERKKSEQEKQDLEDAYHHSQKMEAIGTLAGGIAHDFNNLLAGILGHTELLKLKLSENQDAVEGLTVIENAALRGRDLTAQLLGFARKGRYQEVVVDINKSIIDICALMERTTDKKIDIKTVLNEQAPLVSGDPGQLNQVILNLAVNAIDAMPDGGEVVFETTILDINNVNCVMNRLDVQPGQYSVISVRDTGVGMTPEIMEHIFEPFFTNKEVGSHTGMGLAMVYGVAKNHGGTVTVSSKADEGSVFTVYLPLVARKQQEEEEQADMTAISTREGTVFVVDDESLIRDMAKRMLDVMGCKVCMAEDGLKAVEYYRDHWQDIDVVILDMIMPNMSGVECLHEMRKINPGVKAIMTTGYSQESLADKIEQDQIQGFLQKPFRMKDFSEIVASTIAKDE